MMTDDEIIAVVQAHKGGKLVECRPIRFVAGDESGTWQSVNLFAWNFAGYDYRVAPEPRKPREWWIAPAGSGGLVMNWIVVPDCDRPPGSVKVREVIE